MPGFTKIPPRVSLERGQTRKEKTELKSFMLSRMVSHHRVYNARLTSIDLAKAGETREPQDKLQSVRQRLESAHTAAHSDRDVGKRNMTNLSGRHHESMDRSI